MEDQLITFETAKLAKEKGFSSDATHYYNVEGKLGGTTYYENFSNNGEDNNVYDKIPPLCEAPTQSLLQKWLREQGWHVVINADEEGWFCHTFHTAVPNDISSNIVGQSYEDCLEKALVFLLTQL